MGRKRANPRTGGVRGVREGKQMALSRSALPVSPAVRAPPGWVHVSPARSLLSGGMHTAGAGVGSDTEAEHFSRQTMGGFFQGL